MIPSPLYKYRTIESWSFLEDILSRRRLYAASFRSLNDPMEGLLYEHDKDVSVKYRKAVRTASGRLNICSLCHSRDDTLLWSYYSGGHTGVAIGLNVLARQSPQPRMATATVRYAGQCLPSCRCASAIQMVRWSDGQMGSEPSIDIP
jgi:hypothetical protein